jgi:hypothetical protein
MEVLYRSRNGRLTAKVEADTPKALFESIAEFQEVFEADEKCGNCGSTNIRFNVRHIDSFTYYEHRCECGAALGMGQSKDMKSLFPKRRDKDGNPLPNNGWVKYQPRDEYDQR